MRLGLGLGLNRITSILGRIPGYTFTTNGTNYIDMGFINDSTTKFGGIFEWLDEGGTFQALHGGRIANNNNMYGYGRRDQGTLQTMVLINDSPFFGLALEYNKRYRFETDATTGDCKIWDDETDQLLATENQNGPFEEPNTVNQFFMALNQNNLAVDHSNAIYHSFWYEHQGERRDFSLNEGTGNIIKDDQGNEYTIQGTVTEDQWTKQVSENSFQSVLIDTDWLTDCDDVGAMRVASWAENESLIDIITLCASSVGKGNDDGNKTVQSLDAYFQEDNRSGINIGVEITETDTRTSLYHQGIVDNYPSTYTADNQAEDNVRTYRRAVKSCIDRGVRLDIIIIGHSNGMADFMQSTGDDISPLTGAQLIEGGVGRLYVVGGLADSTGVEYNFSQTALAKSSTDYVLANYTKDIVFLGYEVGNSITTGETLKTLYPTLSPPDDIVRLAYFDNGSENGRKSWDLMLMLIAAYGNQALYKIGISLRRGTNSYNSTTGENTFTEDLVGNHYYASLDYGVQYYEDLLNHILEKTDWKNRLDRGVHDLAKP